MVNALLALLAAFLTLLAVPVTLTFRVAWPRGPDNEVRLGWAFGLVRFDATPGERKQARTEPEPGDAQTPQTGYLSTTDVLAALRVRGLRRRMLRFIGALWRAVHKEATAVRLRIGLDDPADTGRLWALLGPLNGLLPGPGHASIRLDPEFAGETLELDASGRLRVVPLRLLWLMAALLLSPPVWRAFRRLRVAD